MRLLLSRSVFIAALGLLFVVIAYGQNNDSDLPGIGKPDDKENASKGFKDTLLKMRIERDKKDFREMLDRGEEAAKLGDQVEKSFESRGTLTDEDRQKINTIEKLIKKIRTELGGSDSDDSDDDAQTVYKPPTDVFTGVKYLHDSTAKLFDELKKTSRFSISAVAIQSSNSAIRAARFLKLGQ